MADHVVEDLYSYASGHLDAREVSRVEEHLRGCAECRNEAAALDALTETLSVPKKTLFDKLSTTLSGAGRFEHLLPRLAKLFDISVDDARDLVTRADDEKSWELELAPGVWTMPVAPGPSITTGFTVLVKISEGAVFPQHAHGGREQVLLLEGGYLDSSGTEFWRGELDVRETGTEHSFAGLPGGCLCAALMFPLEGAH